MSIVDACHGVYLSGVRCFLFNLPMIMHSNRLIINNFTGEYCRLRRPDVNNVSSHCRGIRKFHFSLLIMSCAVT
jgi:hypothetical protein